MQCSDRSNRPAGLTATAKCCRLQGAQSARFLHSMSTKSAPKVGSLSRHRKQKLVISQASSSSQASVTLRAPSNAQQSAPKQQDLEVPRSLLIAIDYTSDAEQALQWALDFVVKPGTQHKCVSSPSVVATDQHTPFKRLPCITKVVHITWTAILAGDKVHLVHVICNPRANTDGESVGQTPLVLSLQHANSSTHSQQTMVAMRTCACASSLVPNAMTAAMMTASFAAKRHGHGQLCNSCMPLGNAGSAAGAGYNRSSSFQEVQDMKAFVKRLEQAELDKVQQLFQKRLQAAGVSYEVSLSVKQADLCATHRLTDLHTSCVTIKLR